MNKVKFIIIALLILIFSNNIFSSSYEDVILYGKEDIILDENKSLIAEDDSLTANNFEYNYVWDINYIEKPLNNLIKKKLPRLIFSGFAGNKNFYGIDGKIFSENNEYRTYLNFSFRNDKFNDKNDNYISSNGIIYNNKISFNSINSFKINYDFNYFTFFRDDSSKSKVNDLLFRNSIGFRFKENHNIALGLNIINRNENIDKFTKWHINSLYKYDKNFLLIGNIKVGKGDNLIKFTFSKEDLIKFLEKWDLSLIIYENEKNKADFSIDGNFKYKMQVYNKQIDILLRRNLIYRELSDLHRINRYFTEVYGNMKNIYSENGIITQLSDNYKNIEYKLGFDINYKTKYDYFVSDSLTKAFILKQGDYFNFNLFAKGKIKLEKANLNGNLLFDFWDNTKKITYKPNILGEINLEWQFYGLNFNLKNNFMSSYYAEENKKNLMKAKNYLDLEINKNFFENRLTLSLRGENILGSNTYYWKYYVNKPFLIYLLLEWKN